MAVKKGSNAEHMARASKDNDLARELAERAEKQASELASAAAQKSADLAGLVVNVEYIKRDIGIIMTKLEKMDTQYITEEEFKPVRSIVYGMVGVILLAVIGALVALVVIP